MKMKKIAALLAVAAASGSAFATDGYFAHGYGMKAKGMGGVATATASDSMGGANNPASMVWAGDRLDIGLDLFSPRRSVERTGSTTPGVSVDGKVDSSSNLFYVPEFGYNKMLGWDMSAGVSVYGNGGMNTNFNGGQIGAASLCSNFNPGGAGAAPFNMLCGTGNLGMNLVQLIVAPTFSMKVNKNHSFGVSLLLGYQKFAAQGLDGFYGFTPAPFTPLAGNNYLTNRGYDDSHGYGLKLGWMGNVSETVTLGAAYTTKMKMSKFDKYKDLFAGQGNFDMPASLDLGISVKATPKLKIAADYQRIDYSGINSVSNASTISSAWPGSAVPPTPPGTVGSLGCDSCRGFGWSSVNVFKLGAEYQYSPNLVLRAGLNHTDNPISSRDVTFNIIAPGVIKDHATLGFTYGVSKDSEVTMAYMHAFKNTVQGASLFSTWTAPATAGTEKLEMYQNSLGIAYGMKF
ncbi:MAG: outer membrane protein transport protein [Sulfuritalea sp.]|jgi:long-chain fatty acid transport protein|nr:outer membrane protein transport protein [Sulfuritalea sp.]